MRTVDAIAEWLEAAGMTHYYGYAGGAVWPLLDALVDRPRLAGVQAKHESHATHQADIHYRVSGKVAPVIVTKGPGLLNCVGGVASAMHDGIPIIVLAGSGPTHFMGKAGMQELFYAGFDDAVRMSDDKVLALADIMRANFDISTGLLLTGSGFAVILACSIRFLALAESSIAAGMAKLPPHLDDAARCLGRTANQTVFTVLLPLIRPAVLTAAVLVGVDSVKELSATILLRPFGFDTLATIVHQNASRAVVEDGAMASLLIMLTAMVPVILLSRALARDETT